MNRFLTNNSAMYRTLRTIVQGIVGVLIANVDAVVSTLSFSAEIKALIVAVVMAILSPIMSALGTEDMKKEDVPHGFFEEGFEEEGNDNDSE